MSVKLREAFQVRSGRLSKVRNQVWWRLEKKPLPLAVVGQQAIWVIQVIVRRGVNVNQETMVNVTYFFNFFFFVKSIVILVVMSLD